MEAIPINLRVRSDVLSSLLLRLSGEVPYGLLEGPEKRSLVFPTHPVGSVELLSK